MRKSILILMFVANFLFANGLIPNNRCALIIAARETKSEAIEYIKYNVTKKDNLRVYYSQNGWYAISLGWLKRDNYKEIINKLKYENIIPQDSYCSYGNKYIREVNINELESYSNTSSYSESSNNSSTCQDIDAEKAKCYALSFGHKFCEEAIYKENPELAKTLSSRIGVSTACNYEIKNSLASKFVPADFLMTILEEGAETACKKAMDDNTNSFAKLFYSVGCIDVALINAGKLDMANSCIRKVENACR